jgi:hypothetical protein
MDFLSTPLPQTTGTEETVVKKSYGWNKGLIKNKCWQQKINDALIQRIFEGKSVKQWVDILDGDKGRIREHIKNGTMETYGPYRQYIGLTPLPRNQWAVKNIFQGKNTKQWSEILNGNPGEIRKHITNNTMITYGPYRRYLGLTALPRGQWNIKRIMTPKGIMTYEQAKKAFVCSEDTIRRRVRSDDFPDWYELKEKVE